MWFLSQSHGGKDEGPACLLRRALAGTGRRFAGRRRHHGDVPDQGFRRGFGAAFAEKGLAELKKIRDLAKVEALAAVPEQEGTGYELTVAEFSEVSLRQVTAALQRAGDEKNDKPLTDVQWTGVGKREK